VGPAGHGAPVAPRCPAFFHPAEEPGLSNSIPITRQHAEPPVLPLNPGPDAEPDLEPPPVPPGTPYPVHPVEDPPPAPPDVPAQPPPPIIATASDR
jgi:hypothetical protein